MDVFIFLIVMMFPRVYSCIKIFQIGHFKCVQFIICKLYLNKAVKEKMYKIETIYNIFLEKEITILTLLPAIFF